MALPRKKSPLWKEPEVPLPKRKPTDPPTLPVPTFPHDWPAYVVEKRLKSWFARPQSPWTDEHPLAPELVARMVVLEVMQALEIGRFPRKRWEDWLTRRAHGLYRLNRVFRKRMNGENEREWCYTYMRHWLYCGMRRTPGFQGLARRLPDEMWCGHSPATHGRVLCFEERKRRRGRAV